MAQAQILDHEIKVVMQTLAVIWNQIRLTSLLVVPRLVGRAGLHGRENTDQPRLLTAASQLDLFTFSDAPVFEKLNLLRTEVTA